MGLPVTDEALLYLHIDRIDNTASSVIPVAWCYHMNYILYA